MQRYDPLRPVRPHRVTLPPPRPPYRRYGKTVLSRGRYAEILSDARPFSADESALFDAAAQHAYESFRDKAASSRGMTVEAMQEVAQGRVWSGRRAIERGLVDALGGVGTAVELAKKAAGIPDEDKVTVVEVGRRQVSPLQAALGEWMGGAGGRGAEWEGARGVPQVRCHLTCERWRACPGWFDIYNGCSGQDSVPTFPAVAPPTHAIVAFLPYLFHPRPPLIKRGHGTSCTRAIPPLLILVFVLCCTCM